MSAIELPVLILNPHVPLARAAEPPGPEVNVPDPVAISSRIAATISSERGIGRTPGPTRALLEPRRPLPQVAVDPLVASLPRDAVELAQLGDRKRVAKVIGDELRPLVHRGRLLPRHGHLLGALPGFPVSPMSLD